jgi:hypothetical protein
VQEGDDDLDLFGDETEEEAAAAAEREAAKKAAGTKKKESKFFFLLIFISACWITVYGNCIVLEMHSGFMQSLLDSWMQSLAECKAVFFRLVDCHIWMA